MPTVSKQTLAKIRQRNIAAIARNKQAVFDYLKDKACVDCGISDTIVLTFDHTKDKKYEISDMVFHAYSLKTIFQEIEKCVIRCANCHLRDEARKRGVWKSLQAA